MRQPLYLEIPWNLQRRDVPQSRPHLIWWFAAAATITALFVGMEFIAGGV